MAVRDTPAAFSRILHKHVKDVRDELRAMGYPEDIIYALLMDVMLRLAFEETGDAGVASIMEKLAGKANLRN